MSSRTAWRKSSHSCDTANCVETLLGPRVLVRDGKDCDGGTLAFTGPAWVAFLRMVRHGHA